MRHIPALDGLRGLAILLVLIFHWFPNTHWINTLPNGPIGVTLFFVLSGFLITSILLQAREKNDFLTSFKSFIFRRALRIFPIYYLLLLAIYVLGRLGFSLQTDFFQHPEYYLFYAYNHYLEMRKDWSDLLSPFWSLAVEEQFYLIWPIIILAFPCSKRWKELFLFFGLIGILARYYFIFCKGGLGLYTITCVDCFSWGAWTAHLYRSNTLTWNKYCSLLLLVIGAGWIYVSVFQTDQDLGKMLGFRTLTSWIGMALIYFALNYSGRYQIFEWNLLRWIGKISYGLYLYHMVVPNYFVQFLQRLSLDLSPSLAETLGIGALFLVAHLSFVFIERPIQKLKNRYA